jgi:hypothetical protein
VIGWATINPVLIEVFTEIATDTTRDATGFEARWKEGPRAFIQPEQKADVLLKVTSVIGLGEDETRREVIEGKLYETQVGQRQFTLQVQVIVPEHTDDQWAMAVTERIRTRVRRPRHLDRLLDVDVDVRRILAAQKASFKDGGRVVSAAMLDIICGTVVNDADPIPVNWIQYVVVSGEISDGAGVLPAPPNWLNHEIPTIP